jgi:peptidoglycan hydrolase CwlO-like protein
MTGAESAGEILGNDWRYHFRTPSHSDRDILDAVLEKLHQISESIDHLFKKEEELMTGINATQADIDALTTQITQNDAQLQSVVATLQSEIANLQGQGVDISGLQAAVAQLTTDANTDTATVTPAAPTQDAPVVTDPDVSATS